MDLLLLMLLDLVPRAAEEAARTAGAANEDCEQDPGPTPAAVGAGDGPQEARP